MRYVRSELDESQSADSHSRLNRTAGLRADVFPHGNLGLRKYSQRTEEHFGYSSYGFVSGDTNLMDLNRCTWRNLCEHELSGGSVIDLGILYLH